MTWKAGKSWIAFVLLFGGVFLAASLAGCQSFGRRDMGRLVPDFHRVAIPDGATGAKTFKTRDMTVDYQYRRAGDQLKVWGSGDIRFESIKELVFHLYFLDHRGEVIGIQNFFSYLDHTDFIDMSPGKRNFHRDFTIPSGAEAFALGYDGVTGRLPGADAISFSYYPFD